MVTIVYLIRHCQSMGNIQQRFQGRFDADVSPDGEKQLELLSLRFRNMPIDRVYTSPLTRARRTAEAVARYHNVEILEEPDLLEIDCGAMENLLLPEAAQMFPEVARHWDETPDLCHFPNGETMEQVYERSNRALDKIIAENLGRQVVVTTHGGVLRNLYARVTFGGLMGIRSSEVFGNTGVSVLEVRDGVFQWLAINDLSHLPEEMRRQPVKFIFGKAEPI